MMRVSACTGRSCEEEGGGTKPVAVLWNGGKPGWGCVEEEILKSKLSDTAADWSFMSAVKKAIKRSPCSCSKAFTHPQLQCSYGTPLSLKEKEALVPLL